MGSSKGHVPIRTCVACGAKGMKSGLIRFVLSGDRLVKDELGKLQGRGVYVCHTVDCAERLSRKKDLHKILKCSKGK